MPLPIVARVLGVHKTEEEIAALYACIPLFDKVDSIKIDDTCNNQIQMVTRKFEDDGSKTKLLIIPAMTLKRYGKPTKSDIRWIWKFLKGIIGLERLRIDDNSILTAMWTNEPELYVASSGTIASNWVQPTWIWKWIEYCHIQMAHHQKKGYLRFVLADIVNNNNDEKILNATITCISKKD